MECPNCGHEMSLEEKDTSSGRDMRTYRCRQCGRSEDVDNGIALWQVLSDAREVEESRYRSQGNRTYRKALSGIGQRLLHFFRTLWRGKRDR
ncbi:MAG: hypothetical protein ACLP7P_02170 [Rhodomicrobium sp.]